MKPKMLLPMLMLCAGCGQGGDSYEIDIRCQECSNAQVSLWKYNGNGIEPEGLAKMEHGHAVFKGNVAEPSLMYVYVDEAVDYLPVFVENAEIDIDYVWQRPSRSVVTGSQCHKTFSDFLQSYSAYSDKGTGIDKMIENAADNDDTLMMLSLTENLNVLKREEVEFQTQYVLQNITSPVSAYILCSNLMYSLNQRQLGELVERIGPETGNSSYLKMAQEYLKTMPVDSAAL